MSTVVLIGDSAGSSLLTLLLRAMSLYTGRLPALTELPEDASPNFREHFPHPTTWKIY